MSVSGQQAHCEDCGELYGGPRFPDLVIDSETFAKIAARPPDGGLFCPNCLIARLVVAGLTPQWAQFTSGPLAHVLTERRQPERPYGDWTP